MVLRKPDTNGLPYPVTPTSPYGPSTTAASYTQRNEDAHHLADRSLSTGPQEGIWSDTNNAWDNDETGRWKVSNELPPALRAGGNGLSTENRKEESLPPSLRVGPAETTPRSSIESQSSNRSGSQSRRPLATNLPMQVLDSQSSHSNNPYLRMKNMNDALPKIGRLDEQNSHDIWADEASNPAPTSQSSHQQYKIEPLPIRTAGPSLSSHTPPEASPSAEPWNTFTFPPERQPPPIPVANNDGSRDEISNVASIQSSDRQGLSQPGNRKAQVGQENYYHEDLMDLNLGDHPNDVYVPQQPFGPPLSETLSPSSPRTYDMDKHLPDLPPEPSEKAPPILPPRRLIEQEEVAPPQPPRPEVRVPVADTQILPHVPDCDAQNSRATKQRSETYQIRLVNWFDVSSPTNPRRSPIMVQNANGPCPLLALVNALTLSTPADVSTALVETLRVREQVSLGLLLDAVIDELMSGRRGDEIQDLPDVSDLYAFLITLHTGMNVNPSFVKSGEKTPNIMDASMLDLSTSVQRSRNPGGFEDTREMKLYSAFAIPLIHGWLPPKNHPAYSALERSARTYEDAQNLMFREEELEDKLQRLGLNQDEQLLLEDITSVKYFLSTSATQLTGYGLDTMTEALAPGSIAILFRNDHFSTLYRHPRSGQLLTLVTDMGYAGHDEVVWESLVDVSGEGCEFFAGDFRPVGNVVGDIHPQSSGVTAADDSGWTTVSRNNNSKSNHSHDSVTLESQTLAPFEDGSEIPNSPNTEQEDHDLALAMQLQEEEEDRDRRETAARRREDELSQAYLVSQEASNRRGGGGRDQGRVQIRGQGRGQGRGQEIRPTIPVRGNRTVVDPEAGDDAPPPTYEQAAKGPAYIPPSDQPAPALAASPAAVPISRPQGGRPRQRSAYSQNSVAFNGTPSTRGGQRRRDSSARNVGLNRSGGLEGAPGVLRRRSGGAGGLEEEDDGKKDCVVM